MFAPPDGTVTVPLNKVLKYNFWAGSYVFRLLDQEKLHFTPFFADRRRLQHLSDSVSAALPMAFAGLADLLGDVLIQVPVTIVVPNVDVPRDADDLSLDATWSPGSTPRALSAAARAKWDELLTGAALSGRFQGGARIPVDGRRQPVESEIWDAETGAILSATAPTAILRRVSVNEHIQQHEPRLFSAVDPDGERREVRIRLAHTTTTDDDHRRGRRPGRQLLARPTSGSRGAQAS